MKTSTFIIGALGSVILFLLSIYNISTLSDSGFWEITITLVIYITWSFLFLMGIIISKGDKKE